MRPAARSGSPPAGHDLADTLLIGPRTLQLATRRCTLPQRRHSRRSARGRWLT